MRLRLSLGCLLGLAFFLGGCGLLDRSNGEKPAPAAKGKQGPVDAADSKKPSPPVKDCFAEAQWAGPQCKGDGKGAPAWWGAKRWPELKLQSQQRLVDSDGATRWNLSFVRPAALAAPKACQDRLKASIAAGFPEVVELPSSQESRASFRARNANYELTAVCGTSFDGELLVNLNLRARAAS